MGKFGRDKSFYDNVENKKNSGQRLREHFDYGITHIANYDNPYMNYILTNKFKRCCLPVYLRKENFDLIRKRIGRIEVRRTDLMGIDGEFDFFNLSDIFEYMDDKVFRKNIERLHSLSREGGMIAYYNMQCKKYLGDDYFELLEEKSHEYTKKMQAYFYDEFLLYKVRKNERNHGRV
jgi:S-adenosylmethionine-diacylglycerol 3-amino-3-carboxypropyl transferase